MIFVTGDVHGDWVSRLAAESFYEQNELSKDDYVIICGDMGIWDNSASEKYNLDWLEGRSFTTLFLDGNHENYDILDNLPVSEWHGGKVSFLRPSVIHLLRGQVYNIEGKTFFTFGGARCHDIQDGVLERGDPRIRKWSRNPFKMFRINHLSWWAREMPSKEEMEEGRQNLAAVDNKVDCMLTHCAPTSTNAQFDPRLYEPNDLTEYLEELKHTVSYRRWYMGHYHINKQMNDKEAVLYSQILRIL